METYFRLGKSETTCPSIAIFPDYILPYKYNCPPSLNLSIIGSLKGPSGSRTGIGALFNTYIRQGPLYHSVSYFEWIFWLLRESIGINFTSLNPHEFYRNADTKVLMLVYLA